MTKRTKHIKITGSKNGTIIAHRWSPDRSVGASCPYPGMGRWLRTNLELARFEIATGEAEQYVTGQSPEWCRDLPAFANF